MCGKSFALGRWRGAYGSGGISLARDVPLAAHICRESYEDGFAAGRAERAERTAYRPARRDARR